MGSGSEEFSLPKRVAIIKNEFARSGNSLFLDKECAARVELNWLLYFLFCTYSNFSNNRPVASKASLFKPASVNVTSANLWSGNGYIQPDISYPLCLIK